MFVRIPSIRLKSQAPDAIDFSRDEINISRNPIPVGEKKNSLEIGLNIETCSDVTNRTRFYFR